MHHYITRLAVIALLLGGAVFGIVQNRNVLTERLATISGTVSDGFNNLTAAVLTKRSALVAPEKPELSETANGLRRFVVVPLRYTDTDSTELKSTEEWRAEFEDLALYYRDASQNKLQLQFEVLAPVAVPSAYTYNNTIALMGRYGAVSTALHEKGFAPTDYDGIVFISEASPNQHIGAYHQILGSLSSSQQYSKYENVRGYFETARLYEGNDSVSTTWKGILDVYSSKTGIQNREEWLRSLRKEMGVAIGFGGVIGHNFGDILGTGPSYADLGAYFKYLAGWISAPTLITTAGEYSTDSSDPRANPKWYTFSVAQGKSFSPFLERPVVSPFGFPLHFLEGDEVGRTTKIMDDKYKRLWPDEGCNVVNTEEKRWFVKDIDNGMFRVGGDDKFNDECATVKILDVSTSPHILRVGQPATITVRIQNIGKEVEEGVGVWMALAFEYPQIDGYGLRLAPGEQKDVTITWTPLLPGLYDVEYGASSDNHAEDAYKGFLVVADVGGGLFPRKATEKHTVSFRAADGQAIEGKIIFRETSAVTSNHSVISDALIPSDPYVYIKGTRLAVESVTLNDGDEFDSFGGDCIGAPTSCALVMDSDKVLVIKKKDCPSSPSSASSRALRVGESGQCEANATITKSGTGSGKIRLTKTEPQGGGVVVCDDCSGEYSFPKGTIIDARATALAGSDFAAWSGGFCIPDSADKFHCQGTIGDDAVTISAEFAPASKDFTFTHLGDVRGVTAFRYRLPSGEEKTFSCTHNTCDSKPAQLPEGTTLRAEMREYINPNGNEKTMPYGWGGACAGVVQTSACEKTVGKDGITITSNHKIQYRISIGRADTNGDVWVNSQDESEGRAICRDNTSCPPGSYKDIWIWQDKEIRVSASGEEGYRFASWTRDCQTASPGYCTFRNRAATVQASFSEFRYAFRVSKDCNPYSTGRLIDGYYCGTSEQSIYVNGVFKQLCNEGCMISAPESIRGGTDTWRVERIPLDGSFLTNIRCVASGGYFCSFTEKETGGYTISVFDQDHNNAYERITSLDLVYSYRADYDVEPRLSRVGNLRVGGPTFYDIQINTAPGKVPNTQTEGVKNPQATIQQSKQIASLSSVFSKLFSPFTKPLFSRITGSAPQRASLTSGGADLVAVDAIINPSLVTPNKSHSITAFVANNGDAAYGDYFGTSLRITRDGAPADEYPFERYRYTASLASGGVEEIAWPYVWAPTTEGTYTASLCVDRFRSVTDVNPANDCLTPFTVTVGSATAILRTGPAKVNEGAVIKNINPAQDMSGVSKQRNYGNVLIGSAVSLRAVPDAGFQFTGWSGDDALKCRYPNGDRTTCMFTMTAETKIFADFIAVPDGLLGDVNNDNRLTAADALAILKSAVGQTVSLPNMNRADVDCNGKVQAKDALVVLKASVGSIPTPLVCAAADAATTGNITFTKVGDGTGAVAPLTPVQRANDTELAFTAAPATGSSFAGWEGDCTGTGECRVTVNGFKNATIRARFTTGSVTPPPVPPTTPPPVTPPPPPTGDAPDLVTLGDRDLRTSPAKPTANRALSVLAKIQNQGKAQSRSFTASLRIDQDNNGTWDFADVERILPLKVNQYKALKFKKAYTPPTTGTYKIEVCVDDGALSDAEAIPSPIPNYTAGPTAESSESNNCQSMTVDVLPEKGRAASAAGALAALTLLVGVPVGIAYLARARMRITTTV